MIKRIKFFMFVLLAWWLFGVALVSAPQAAELEGYPVVLDGDTLRIGDSKVRFHGIDAPELSQACHNGVHQVMCGLEAQRALTQIIDGQSVACRARTIDKYGRIIGKCYANGIDLQHVMVRSGWAVAYRKYSRDYIQAEDFARREKRGIWQGAFMYPCQHRQMKRGKPVTICN